MDPDDLHRHIVHTFDGTNVLENEGDLFYIYDPGRNLPPQRQMPWATLVRRDAYDPSSDLDRRGAWRVNIGLTKAAYTERFGPAPNVPVTGEPIDTGFDYTATDTLMPHPVYAPQHWVCVVNPGERTADDVHALLAEAHGFAARKFANQRSREA